MKIKVFGVCLILIGIISCFCGAFIYTHFSIDSNLYEKAYQAGILEGAGIVEATIGLLLTLFGNKLK